MWEWSPWALPGFLSLTVGAVLAIVVGRSRAGARANGALAALLALEGIAVCLQNGFPLSLSRQQHALLSSQAAFALLPLLVAQYLVFLGTLRSPLTRPLGAPRVRVGIHVVGAAGSILVLARPETFAAAAVDVPYAAWLVIPEPAMIVLLTTLGLVSLYGFVVALHLFARTPRESPNRPRAAAYALAFGVRDVGFFAMSVGIVLYETWRFGAPGRLPVEQTWIFQAVPVSSLVFMLLMTYGILRTQLFDIDLRIKVGISRGTVVSIALAVVFVVSKIVEAYASRNLGLVAGGVAAGLLLFAAPRLNKLGDKVASTALPQATGTSQYVAFKKLEVYKAAVESALEGDGRITSDERHMLDSLRGKLGLSSEDCAAIEGELAPG